jgi:FKBP-type peptidyl-prolyl cis-trans isomerase SlyD
MLISKHKVVGIHYTLTNDGGEVLDTSDGREPLVYLHGTGNIIPGLESALEGKQAGDNLSVAVPPAQGYGELIAELRQAAPRAAFGQDSQLEVGMRFRGQAGPDQPAVVFTITEIDGDNITIDGNHPLAGENLNFKVEILSVRDATPTEISHGHVHGEHDHHH